MLHFLTSYRYSRTKCRLDTKLGLKDPKSNACQPVVPWPMAGRFHTMRFHCPSLDAPHVFCCLKALLRTTNIQKVPKLRQFLSRGSCPRARRRCAVRICEHLLLPLHTSLEDLLRGEQSVQIRFDSSASKVLIYTVHKPSHQIGRQCASDKSCER